MTMSAALRFLSMKNNGFGGLRRLFDEVEGAGSPERGMISDDDDAEDAVDGGEGVLLDDGGIVLVEMNECATVCRVTEREGRGRCATWKSRSTRMSILVLYHKNVLHLQHSRQCLVGEDVSRRKQTRCLDSCRREIHGHDKMVVNGRSSFFDGLTNASCACPTNTLTRCCRRR